MSTRGGNGRLTAVGPVGIRAVLYLRLSDLRDDDLDASGQGKTFGGREQELRGFVEDMGGTVVDVIIENDVSSRDGRHRNASAFKRRRVTLPDGTKAMRVVREGFDKVIDHLRTGFANMLVTEDSDRITRDQFDGGRLIELVEANRLNVRTLTGAFNLTNGGTDVEIGAAWDAVNKANQESRKIANRVRRGRKRKAYNGEFGGGRRPYGFESDGVTIRPDEADIILTCSERVLQLDAGTNRLTSLKTLARELRDASVPTVTGAQWSAETLKEILVRPRNAGIMVYRGEELGPAPWPAIVPVHLFRRVVALLTDPGRDTARGAGPKWLGSGQFRCGACADGTTVEVTMGNLKKAQPDENGNETVVIVGKREPRFRCSKTSHLTRNVANVLDLVERATIARLSQPDAVDLLPPVADTSAVDLDALATEAQGIRGRLKDLTADYVLGRGDLSKTQLKVASEAAQKRLTEIDEQLKSTVDSPLSLLVGADDVAAEWHARTFGEKQAILDALWVVTILPQGSGGPGFRPELIDIRERSTLPPGDAAPGAA